jgi:peptide/nickel transport system permease protein
MKKYLVKRLLLMIPDLFRHHPHHLRHDTPCSGDYTKLKMGVGEAMKAGELSAEVVEQERKLYGLDKPIIVGYGQWLWKFVRLDMGTSRKDGRPVSNAP